MSAKFPIYPTHTAVLSMDCQSDIVSVYLESDKDAFLGRISSVLNHARGVGITVIHVQVGFRAGLPEVSSRNVLFRAIKSSAHLMMRRGRKTAKVARARKLAVHLYWMWRKGWDYKQWKKFGWHVGQPGHRDGVQ